MKILPEKCQKENYFYLSRHEITYHSAVSMSQRYVMMSFGESLNYDRSFSHIMDHAVIR